MIATMRTQGAASSQRQLHQGRPADVTLRQGSAVMERSQIAKFLMTNTASHQMTASGRASRVGAIVTGIQIIKNVIANTTVVRAVYSRIFHQKASLAIAIAILWLAS